MNKLFVSNKRLFIWGVLLALIGVLTRFVSAICQMRYIRMEYAQKQFDGRVRDELVEPNVWLAIGFYAGTGVCLLGIILLAIGLCKKLAERPFLVV